MCCPHGGGQWLPAIWRWRSDQKRREFFYTKRPLSKQIQAFDWRSCQPHELWRGGGKEGYVLSCLDCWSWEPREMRLDSLHSPTLLGWRYMGIRVSGHTPHRGHRNFKGSWCAFMYSCTAYSVLPDIGIFRETSPGLPNWKCAETRKRDEVHKT